MAEGATRPTGNSRRNLTVGRRMGSVLARRRLAAPALPSDDPAQNRVAAAVKRFTPGHALRSQRVGPGAHPEMPQLP
jgi:hypothetical protein